MAIPCRVKRDWNVYATLTIRDNSMECTEQLTTLVVTAVVDFEAGVVAWVVSGSLDLLVADVVGTATSDVVAGVVSAGTGTARTPLATRATSPTYLVKCIANDVSNEG